MAAPRKTIADTLKSASFSYLAHKGFSCHTELGLNSWGKLRADVLAINLKSHLYICEIKSSVADYSTDKKWRQYLPYSNRMWFVFTADVYERLKERLKVDLKGSGVGVFILCPKTGYLKSVQSSKHRLMKKATKRNLVLRMAWRGGTSKRTHRHRQRHFIEEALPC
jgi:hypothetical protein